MGHLGTRATLGRKEGSAMPGMSSNAAPFTAPSPSAEADQASPDVLRFLPAELLEGHAARAQFFAQGIGGEKARQAAIRYVMEFHPGSSCAFLVGSYAKRTATPMSDIDMFIVDDNVRVPFLAQSMVDHFPIQASAFNTSTAWSLLEKDYQSGSFYLVAAFAYGDLLTGYADLQTSLARRASDMLRAGAPTYSGAHIASCRATVVNQLIKLSRNADRAMQFGAASKLLETFGRYLQLASGVWVSGDVPFDDFLDRNFEYQRAVAAVPSALEGDPLPLMHAVAQALMERGEIRWSTDRSAPLPLHV